MKNTRAVTQLVQTFPYQSYFDSALLETAIDPSPSGSPFVESTIQHAQTPGTGVALHPASECPVAIRFKGGDSDSSGTVILTPGQRMMIGDFSDFDWGLPFGWLGGGIAMLDVMHRMDVEVAFDGSQAPEMIFHRQRLIIGNDFSPATDPNPNWPIALPWANAFAAAQPQQAAATLGIRPTKTLLRLRVNDVNPITVYGVFGATVPFDTNGAGVVSAVDRTIVEISFPGSVAASGAFPIVWLEDPVTWLGGPDAFFYIVDDTATVVEGFIDAVRYGKVG